MIGAAETAAEARDAASLSKLVDDAYRDEYGYDRRAVVNIARAYMLRNQQIHLFTVIKSVDLVQPGRARAEVLVAMTGRPVDRADQLVDLRAELMRFQVELNDDGEGRWRVTGASWRRAELTDFL